MDGLRWTAHLEGYLQTLDEEPETAFDHLLVTLVRLKLLADEANKPLLAPMQVNSTDNSGLPQVFQVRSLQNRVDQIKHLSAVESEYNGKRYNLLVSSYLLT